MHYWGQCPYIDETQRQKGFLSDPEKAKVSEFEAKDRTGLLNKIRNKNKRYKRQRTQPPGSDSIEIDAGDDPVSHQSHETYAVYSSAFNNPITSGSSYPLLHSWVLDPGTDIHICNNPTEFTWKHPALPDDIVLAGAQLV